MDPICHPHTGIETSRSIRGPVAVWALHLPAKIKRHNMFGILSVKRRLPVARGLASIMAAAMLSAPTAMTAGIWDEGNIENGQALFNANCASCHLVTDGVLAAPGLAGIADRWGSSDELLVQCQPPSICLAIDLYTKLTLQVTKSILKYTISIASTVKKFL